MPDTSSSSLLSVVAVLCHPMSYSGGTETHTGLSTVQHGQLLADLALEAGDTLGTRAHQATQLRHRKPWKLESCQEEVAPKVSRKVV